jgi:hypothetical protein
LHTWKWTENSSCCIHRHGKCFTTKMDALNYQYEGSSQSLGICYQKESLLALRQDKIHK